MKRLGTILIILFFIIKNLFAVQPVLSIYPWYELDPFIYEEGREYPLPKEEAAKGLLEESRQIFSGMIYGYQFTYTPSDKKRQVNEEFQLTLYHEIKWGDPQMRIKKSEIHDNRLIAKVDYTLNEAQKTWIQAWENADIHVSEARGESDLFKGPKNKLKALENSIKEAIRYWARKKYFNKPKEISGRLIIEEEPRFLISSGTYIAHTRIRLIIEGHTPYLIF